jgi:hypothetical protein
MTRQQSAHTCLPAKQLIHESPFSADHHHTHTHTQTHSWLQREQQSKYLQAWNDASTYGYHRAHCLEQNEKQANYELWIMQSTTPRILTPKPKPDWLAFVVSSPRTPAKGKDRAFFFLYCTQTQGTCCNSITTLHQRFRERERLCNLVQLVENLPSNVLNPCNTL